MAQRSNGSLHADDAYVGANMIGIARHAQGVRSRADSLAFVPGNAYEDYGTGGTRPGRPPREIRLACCKATNFRRSLIRDPAGRSGIKGALSFPETDQCTFS